VYRNKPVQGPPGHESAGYHGYWITDFTSIDPHLGTEAEFDSLITATHARGMKVYLDVVINHTADVIRYRECEYQACVYRGRAEYPSDFAYTPNVPKAEAHIKKPDWLNDPIYYHNRGNSTFEGESATMGDFSGLDDLNTESPRVVQGFIDIFGEWIDRVGPDGYRIDTAKHVNPEFWQVFVPAMLARAAARGIPNFHIFGEVFTDRMDPAYLARYTREDKLPSVLDFAFAIAVRDTVAGNAGTEELARVFAGDSLYEGGAAMALQLPTFVSNHDDGRFGYFVERARPRASDDEVLARVRLAYAMLLTLRGVPTIYYGDEQGFAGHGRDQAARQDMFASRVASYNDQRLLGAGTTNAVSHFDTAHPLFRLIAELSTLRRSHAALRRGMQIVRASERTPGLFAVSRMDPQTGHEVLVAFNTSASSLSKVVDVETTTERFETLSGECSAKPTAPGRYRVELGPFDFAICAAGELK
jgi:glycosidase